MKVRLLQTFRNIDSGKTLLMLETDERPDLEDLKDKDLRCELKVWRNRRSKDANAMLWACLQDIAAALGSDKWTVYLQMLKRYGKFTYVLMPEKAVEQFKAGWRECEEVGEVDVNGRKSIQLLCYFGSSTYDTKQFSTLLNGVISEMREMGLQIPERADVRRALEEWERIQSSKQAGAVSSAEEQTA